MSNQSDPTDNNSCGYSGYNRFNNNSANNFQYQNNRYQQQGANSNYAQKRKYNNNNAYNSNYNRGYNPQKKHDRRTEFDPKAFYHPAMVKDPWDNLI